MSTAIQTNPIATTVKPPALPGVYRWLNVVIAATAMTATLPGRTHGLGMITKPVLDEPGLGISESLFAVYNFWAILIGSAMVIPVGWLLDRIGPRFVTGAVSLGLGLVVLAMGFASEALFFFLALILVRGLGQGSLSVASIALVGKSFSRRVGIAMGVFTILLSIGFMASTLGLGYAVKTMGWRQAWCGMGWLLLAGMAPLAWLLSRNDTRESAETDDSRDPDRLVADATLGQALATPAFWVWAFGVGLFNLVWSAVTLFNETLLLDHGLNHSVFMLVMGVLVFTGLPSNILAGWLSHRWSMSKLLGVGMAVLAVSLAGFPYIMSQWGAVAYGTAMGISGGVITVVFFAIFRHAFGKQHMGSIQGTVQVISVLCSALGPWLLVRSRLLTDSPDPFFFGCGSVALGLAFLCWFVREPHAP